MQIGFIGAGQMARALAHGLVNNGLVQPNELVAADVAQRAMEQFRAELPGSQVAADNQAVVDKADVVVLAVKPQHLAEALANVNVKKRDCLFVSIVAGVTLAQLEKWLPGRRVVRVMPNTPALVGEGAAGFCPGSRATAEDRQRVRQILSAAGISVEVAEPLLDAVTGLSGSGPAYVFVMIEALADGGVRMGLPRDVALQLATQTVRGAARLLQATGDHPAVWKDLSLIHI